MIKHQNKDSILHYATYTGGELCHSSAVESSEANS